MATSLAGPPASPSLAVDIPPQALDQALEAFAEQTGLQLFYVTDIVSSRKSPGAQSGLAPSEALAVLLEGTGLAFEFLNARAVRIFPAPNIVSPAVVPALPQDPSRHAFSGELALEEVLVTARRREEEQSKVPISMVVLSMEDLKASGVTSIDDLGALVPSLWFSQTPDLGSGALTSLNIRGVSDRNTPTTGLYLDDTPIPAAIGYSNFRSFPYTFDLNRIEVLRGPQLQLFGEGNQAGAIRYIYNQPSLSTFTVLAQGEVAVPAFGDISYGAGIAAGGPLIRDVLGFRVSAWARSDGGFVDRVDPFTGAILDKNANHTWSESFRAALTLAVNEAMQIAPSFTYSSYRLHDSQFFFTELSDVAAAQLRNGTLVPMPYDDSFYVGAVKVMANLGAVELDSVSSYFHRLSDAWVDGTPNDPVDYSVAVAGENAFQQGIFMQELRLRSADPNASFAWDIGAFYSTMNLRNTENLVGASLPGGLLTETARSQQTRIGALGEVSVRLAKGLTLNAGLHSEHASTATTAEGPPVFTTGEADSVILPQFRLSYQAAEHELLYLTAAKGYGTGGTWALVIGCPVSPAYIGEETLWNYEAGAKTGLLDGHLQLDTSVFHMQWNNSGPGYEVTCAVNYLGTPGPAASNGFDIAVHALAGAHVRTSVAVSYADARYTQTWTGYGFVVRQGLAVGALPHVVAPWNVTASLEYSVPLSGSATGILRAEDIFRSRNPGPFQDDDPASPNYTPGNTPDPSTNLLNLRATVRRGSYDVALFVNNVLDSRPTVLRFGYGGPGSVQGGPVSPVYATTFRPRTVGLSASWHF